ncbi:MAG: hypothetical protein DRQ47_03970 [Gammaproteobacteria bacterium]|nr:MAG: hypothetical protein DRQ47_03970 [Gammaproteobacteria bacterium]
MVNSKQILLFVFFALIFTCSTVVEPYPFSWIVKLIPMAILIFITFGQLQTTAHKLFLTGLIFSSFGDFFLDYDRVNWFVYGLLSFLIAHLFYMMSFVPIEKKRLIPVLGFMLYGIVIMKVIGPGLGELLIPVFAYMAILLMMGITTLLSKKSNIWLIIGGLSFILSDSLIAVNKFHMDIPFAHTFVMATYYFAQFSLVKGMFNQSEETV